MLFQQLHIADDHAAVGGLAHAVNRAVLGRLASQGTRTIDIFHLQQALDQVRRSNMSYL